MIWIVACSTIPATATRVAVANKNNLGQTGWVALEWVDDNPYLFGPVMWDRRIAETGDYEAVAIDEAPAFPAPAPIWKQKPVAPVEPVARVEPEAPPKRRRKK